MPLAKRRNNYWDFDNCLSESKKFGSISEWVKKSPSSYQSAHSNPEWFSACTEHMQKLWEKKWTPELIHEDASKYTTIQEWRRSSPHAYDAAAKKRIVKAVTSHMMKSPKWHGVDQIHRRLKAYDIAYEEEFAFEDCRDKRKLPFDFFLSDFNLLIEHHGERHQRGWQGKGADLIKKRDDIKRLYARNKGIHYLEIREWESSSEADVENLILGAIKQALPNHNLNKRQLSVEETRNSLVRLKFERKELQEIANQYQSRVQFKRGNESAYNFACRHGLINDICKHTMSK